MHRDHYRDLIMRAVLGATPAMTATPVDSETVGKLATALAEAEQGKQILRAKGYGRPGMPIHATVRLVPDAKGK